jgi:hypothetical protein
VEHSAARHSSWQGNAGCQHLLDSRQPGRRAQLIDPTRWPLALFSRSAVQQHPSDVHQPHQRTRINHSALLLIAATLIFAAACAKTDWIDRTLVTVDVTGTWYGYGTSSAGGTSGGMSANVEIWLELEQEGSRVKGSYRQKPDQSSNVSGPIEGTVSGDVFRYRLVRGRTLS